MTLGSALSIFLLSFFASITFNGFFFIILKKNNILIDIPDQSRKFHFTQIQFKKVSAYLQKMEKVEGYEQEVYYVGLLIAVGCRPSEMFSRRWGDVSFETKKIMLDV